ncbi:MAG: PAS domain-containing protein [Armatimonadetes bacterium]|nr:PAS domain-containing protein [Armatimonadota bacterium]
MPTAPLPPDERTRQENLELYQILDTLPEQQYEDLTLLAAQICGAPISLLSLIDRDRQWFKSHRGLELEQTSREVSFCAHAILDEGVLEVPDATQDARFCDNELVTGPHQFRFYAGAPLITPEGHRLGTLCVIDKTPRQLSAGQIEALQALARQAMAQLELRRTLLRVQSADAARVQALSHLAANAALLRQFVEHAPAAIAMLDREMRYIAVSRRFSTDYGLAGRKLEGRHYYEVFPNIPQHWKDAHQRVLAGAVERCDSDEWLRPDGVVDLIQWEVRPWRDARGRIGGIIMLTENITERVRAQRVKNEFVSVVSHELRTPLTSIRGALGLLAGGAAGTMPPTAQQILGIAQKNSERLMLLINDILDIEKIEAGQMRFDLKPVAVPELLHTALEFNREYAHALGVQLHIETSDLPPQTQIMGDEGRLQQVLSNLLSNASKFTPAGGAVHLGAQVRGEILRVSVRDEGPGVASEFVPHLFDKFAQADSSSTRKQGGTGLGLAIARAIVEKHGGVLEYLPPAEDETGATFFFDVPAVASP